jgi:hypothetical protein
MATEPTERSFDELAKGLASGTVSRGKALRWMGGALVGAALASMPGMAWAEGGRCPTGQTRCNDRCVNLQTNRNHCGSCRNRCRSTQICCKGNCVNPQTNARHCGACLNRCPEGEECVAGVCQGEGGCPDSRPECGTGTSARCCPSNQGCLNGTCVDFCSEELQCCCTCIYDADPTTGTDDVYVCQGPTTEDCVALCEASTPPPGMSPCTVGVNCGISEECRGPSEGSRPVCQPRTDGAGTDCGGILPCAPPSA